MTRRVYYLANPDVRNRVIQQIREARDNTRVELRDPRRSTDQNDLLWMRLDQISRNVEWYGQYLSPTDWKDMFTASLRKARVVPGLDPGTAVPLGMRTSEMSKPEMTELLELIAAFGAERGVEFVA